MMQSLRRQLEELEKTDAQISSTTNGDGVPKDLMPLTANKDRNCNSSNIETWNGGRNSVQETDDAIQHQRNGADRTDADISQSGEVASLAGRIDHTITLLGNTETQEPSPEIDKASKSLERMMEPIIDQFSSVDNGNSNFSISESQGVGRTSSVSPAHVPSRHLECNCDALLHARPWSLPTRRTADSLVARFFSRHNVAFPILHERSFRRQYSRLWDSTRAAPYCCGLCSQQSQGKLVAPTIYAVFAITLRYESTVRVEENTHQTKSFFRMAQNVDFLDILETEVGLELVQWLLLIARYLQSTEQLSKCKNVSATAIRMAQSMGLQYSVSEARKRGLLSKPVTQLEHELRSRLWYACVLLERCVCTVRSYFRPESYSLSH